MFLMVWWLWLIDSVNNLYSGRAYELNSNYTLKYWLCILTFFDPSVCVLCQTESLFWPVFVIATLGAMIASQAMISATFSCVKQSMALGCFPRLKIIHTSRKFMGQIYIPVINWFLMIMCIVVVSIFRSTTDIANAYGKVSSTSIFTVYSFSFLLWF
jgi:KUP system potassium uptake protein